MARVSLLFLCLLYAEIPHSAIKVAPVNAHFFRSLCNIPFGFSQFPDDKFSLIGIGRFLKIGKPEIGGG